MKECISKSECRRGLKSMAIWMDILGLEIMLAVARGLEKFILVVSSPLC